MHNENKLIWVTTLLRPVKSAVAYTCSWLNEFYSYVKNRISDLLCGFALGSSEVLRFSEKLQFYTNYAPE